MIYGTGVDIVETARIRKILDKFSRHFEQKCFTQNEIDYCRSKPDPGIHFAARFAAKEAVLKCLGTGISGEVFMKHIEVAHEAGGKPILNFCGNSKEFLERLKLRAVHISLSHERGYAIAMAVAER